MVPSYISFKNVYIQWICIFFLWGTFCNCEKVWDAPPIYTGPALKANMSIKDLLRLHIPNPLPLSLMGTIYLQNMLLVKNWVLH